MGQQKRSTSTKLVKKRNALKVYHKEKRKVECPSAIVLDSSVLIAIQFIRLWLTIQFFHFDNPVFPFQSKFKKLKLYLILRSPKSQAILIYIFQKNVWLLSYELTKISQWEWHGNIQKSFRNLLSLKKS